MKTPKPIFILLLLVLQQTLSAQVQWYQNQDGDNPAPYGTVATTVQPFTSTTFIACYLWRSTGELNTWKISKSNTSGTELKTFFTTATSANAEFKIGRNNTVYVFERSFTPDYVPQYIVYKLDANLHVTAQRNIEFPNGFFIYNMNAFELDDAGNLYFAGDGQYPTTSGGSHPASFVVKTNKNLENQWNRMDSSETSYARLHIDRWGRVLVIEDYYTFFPQVRIRRFAGNGQSLTTFTVNTDASRYSLNTVLDDDDNILLYGGKTVGSSQAMYLKRISRITGNTVYSKTHFSAPSLQLNDLKVDRYGNIFTLVSLGFSSGNQQSRISRIHLSSGNIAWTHTINFSADSCNLTKLVVNDNDRFYAIGEKKYHNYFSKGFALRMKKSGQADGNFASPDSVAFQRSHWLADGIIDNSNRLIAIGSTSDLDTVTYSNNYFRSFAVRLGANNNNNCNFARAGTEEMTEEEGDNLMIPAEATDKAELAPKLNVYPNPVQNQLTISSIDPQEYDRVAIYNMQGALVLQKQVSTSIEKMDISNLTDGMYLLLLHSSVTFKEKSIKFVVRK
ncbi:MAG: T9SS type A sorting domain-containing protein [Bacteroidota bacterium]